MPHYCIEYKTLANAEEGTEPPLPMRIVEAKNEPRALSHVVENTLTVRRAKPEDFMALAKAGREIEKA